MKILPLGAEFHADGQTDMWKNTQMSNFVKIIPLGAEFLADGRPDGHDEANSLFVPE